MGDTVDRDLVETARRAGGYQWIEEQLFEVLGAWVPIVPEPAAKRLLAQWSHHHAWHGELWRDRLPELEELSAAELTTAPSDGIATLVEQLRGQPRDLLTADRIVGVVRVLLPRLASSYRVDLAATSELTDGPTARALSLCLADVTADWHAGEQLLQTLIGDADTARLVAARQGELEGLVAASVWFD